MDSEKFPLTLIVNSVPVNVVVYDVYVKDAEENDDSILDFSFNKVTETCHVIKDELGRLIGEMLLEILEKYIRENVEGQEDFSAEILEKSE
jgi:hypothetical protein